jgi:hypothetical protein
VKGINQKDRRIRVAAAPINWASRVWTQPNLDPDDALDAVVSTGYDGSELGSLGYLATEEDLQHRFAPRQLDLASAFVAVSLAVPIGRLAAEDFRAVLRLLVAGDPHISPRRRRRRCRALCGHATERYAHEAGHNLSRELAPPSHIALNN